MQYRTKDRNLEIIAMTLSLKLLVIILSGLNLLLENNSTALRFEKKACPLQEVSFLLSKGGVSRYMYTGMVMTIQGWVSFCF